MASHVDVFNPVYQDYTRAVSSLLSHKALSPSELHYATTLMIDSVVKRQAAMMAYNDSSLIFGVLFLVTLPLILLLPTRK